MLGSVLLASGLDFLLKEDVVDKGAGSQWHQQSLDTRFEKLSL